MLSTSINADLIPSDGIQYWKDFLESGNVPCCDYCWDRPSNIFFLDLSFSASKDLEIARHFLCDDEFDTLKKYIVPTYGDRSEQNHPREKERREREREKGKRRSGV